MTAARHFALSFFGPIIAGTLFCGLVSMFTDWLERHNFSVMVVMLVGFVGAAMAARWFVRNCIAISCPFCGGKSYEIPGRGNRFACRVCGKDH